MKSKSVFKVLAFSFLVCILSSLITPILADVPHNFEFQVESNGTSNTLTITITHNNPTGTHYVDLVQIDIDGTIHDVNLDPQTEVTFAAEYDLGEIAEIPTIKSRAHCNIHGWSSWNDAVFPTPAPTSTPISTPTSTPTATPTPTPTVSPTPQPNPTDYTPYIIVVVIAALIAVLLILKRRR